VPEGREVRVEVTIEDPSGVSRVAFWYRPSPGAPPRSIPLLPRGDNRYVAVIPGEHTQAGLLAFWVEAWDSQGNGPARAGSPDRPLWVEILAVDREPPHIVHTPPESAREGQAVEIQAQVTDDVSGVAQVLLRYRRRGRKTFTSQRMTPIAPEKFRAFIPGKEVKPPAVEYYIMATDSAGNAPSEWQSGLNPFVLQVTAQKGKKKWMWLVTGAAVVGGGAVYYLKFSKPSRREKREKPLPEPPPVP